MLIGVPKEIKNHEYRVGLVPDTVKELINSGHRIIVESAAGQAIGFTDEHYVRAGAEIVLAAEDVFKRAEMIVKVKEPQANECRLLTADQILFTYLHLAPDLAQTTLLMESGASCIAYETVTDSVGGLPLLAPMSEVAGRLSVQAGAHCLEKAQGGSGTLLGGVTGVAPAKVLIIGGGVVGENAAFIASGMGAQVTILDRSLQRLKELNDKYMGRVTSLYSSSALIEELSTQADLVIGAILLPGQKAPKLLSKKMIKNMRHGSVVVDVAIDQGGCFETSHATTHAEPIYIVDDVVHYCVANMPGAVARTSTMALNNATLPFTLQLANKGIVNALKENKYLLNGLNIYKGNITHEAVAFAHDYNHIDPTTLL